MVIIFWIFRNFTPSSIEKYFGKLQLLSAGLFSLGHGTSDAQKTMGVISGLLYKSGYLSSFLIPFWVILICHAAIGLGTMAGGWRIVRTMGQKITKLKPVGGFCAETAGALTLLGTAVAGIPVQYNPYHHGGDHGSWGHAPAFFGALGRCESDRVGLGPDNSALSGDFSFDFYIISFFIS